MEILPPATAQLPLVSEMWRFLIFSKVLKELIYKKILIIWKYHLDEDTTLLSVYTLASQNLPLNMTAQIVVVFEIWRLLWLFEKVFINFIWLFFPKFPTLYLVPVRVLSKVANLACKYDCSNRCSFRDMTFFVKFPENLKFYYYYLKFQIRSLVVGCCQSTLRNYKSCLQIWLFKSL